jgi:hypothetical protein
VCGGGGRHVLIANVEFDIWEANGDIVSRASSVLSTRLLQPLV